MPEQTVFVVFNPRLGELEVFSTQETAQEIASSLGEAIIFERVVHAGPTVKHECYLGLRFLETGMVDFQVFRRLSIANRREGVVDTVNAMTGKQERAEYLETGDKAEALQFIHAVKGNANEDKKAQRTVGKKDC